MADADINASQDIAVVGMAGRFPGARNIGEFWHNLRDGVESVTRFSGADLLGAGEDPDLLRDPHYVRAGAPLDDVELFDAGFFGFSAREAAILDPQHRHFLEVCWEALEDAGHVPESFPGAIGVFAGAGMHDYYVHHLAPNRRLMQEVGPFLLRHTGNDKDFLTTRVSYCLDLKGPSVAVQTACSTSLVAIHMAAQSLLNHECDLALAGGVSIQLPHRRGYLYLDGEILSPDGHCRAFDAGAGGTIFGSGAGVVVLRRAADALAARDHVYALLRGSAVNNDGRGKVSYLAPSLDGQARCVAEALAIAGVPAPSIGYVEAHGTGTPIGDPIEIAALTQAYGVAAGNRCAVGSVKTNIGHLDTAAGVASFIKAVLALEHRQIPPSLNFSTPNPACAFDQSPFHVNGTLTPWASGDAPRRAAVNSLGVGGTNAHVVLEEAPPVAGAVGSSATSHLLCLAARSPAALERSTERLMAFLRANPECALGDVAYTLQVGRRAFAYRRTVVAGSSKDVVRQLEASRGGAVAPVPATSPPVVFMFPGGGSQYPDMGRDLYEREPVFRHHVDCLLAIVETTQRLPLRQWLFPQPCDVERASTELERATHSLLVTFAIEYAMAQLWMSRGVQPAALIGHSLGELVAACVAGVMSLSDAVAMVAARGRLLDRLPEGATLAVGLADADLVPHLSPGLSIAAVNAPTMCVVSGSREQVAVLEATLAARDVDVRRLRLSFAAHSSLLDGHLDIFERDIAAIRFYAPALPLISNATGRWVDPSEIGQAGYWVEHLRRTVHFSEGLARVIEDHPGCVLLDVGPGTTLASLAAQRRQGAQPRAIVSSLRHPQDATPDRDVLLGAVGRLWTAGVAIDWSRHLPAGRRVSLPTYPFEQARHWIDLQPADNARPEAAPSLANGPTRLPSIDDWFSTPGWRAAEPAGAAAPAGTTLVFETDDPVHAGVRRALVARGQRVVRVTRGPRYSVTPGGGYEVRPDAREDYVRLLEELSAEGIRPSRVVYLWTSLPAGVSESIEQTVDAAFFGPLFLAQAWCESDPDERLHLAVVTHGMQRVALESVPHPELALVLGPCQVIPKENPAITCASVDWTSGVAAIERLVAEVCAQSPLPIVAIRDEGRFVPSPRKLDLPKNRAAHLVRPGGVYLITGGLGAIGLTLAEALTRTPDVKIALLTRQRFPAASEWEAFSRSGDDKAAVTARLSEMVRQGAGIDVLTCDVTDEHATRVAVTALIERHGALHGVIHAAGILDDGPFQLKTRSGAHAVIAPKLHGTLALERALAGRALDFFVMCSSTSTVQSPPGQIDYVAANAFLEAFAAARSGTGLNARSIAWGAWAGGGMAVRAIQEAGAARHRATERHPLLGRLVDDGSSGRVYQARYDADELWVLDQHRLKDGTALLPGSGFVELFRAAAADNQNPPSGPIQLRDLHLLAPLHIGVGESRDVRTVVRDGEDGTEVFVATRVQDRWIDHARATIVEAAATETRVSEPSRIDIAAVRARCAAPSTAADRPGGVLQDRHLRFGPRWQALRSFQNGPDEALVECELPSGYTDDLPLWAAHPALLDVALHAGLPLLSAEVVRGDLFVPISIGAIRLDRTLPASFVGHARLSSDVHAKSEVVSFDVTLADSDGLVVMEVEDLLLRRLDQRARAAWASAAASQPDRRSTLAELVDLGIEPHEGAEVFFRAIAPSAPPRLYACPVDLPTLTATNGDEPTWRPEGVAPPPASGSDEISRPRDEYERTLCEIWSELLGIPAIGIHDNFFELGGHSLIAVRLFNRIRKIYEVSLGLAVLFDAPTVSQCAAVVRRELGVSAVAEPTVAHIEALAEVRLSMEAIRRSACLVPIQPRGARVPLFLLPGMGGNVLGFQKLTKYLPPDQPVVGLQSLGVDGRHQPLPTLRDIAAHFITEIKSVQPTGPYRLAGYSFGGMVAFEIARQLEPSRDRVDLLALLDTLLDYIDPATSPWGGAWWRRAAHHSRMLLAAPNGRLVYASELATTLRRRLSDRRAEGRFRPVKDANTAAMRNYRPERYEGVVTLLRATDRRYAGPGDTLDRWASLARGGVVVREVPGNHFSIFDEANLRPLARSLGDALVDAGREDKTPALPFAVAPHDRSLQEH